MYFTVHLAFLDHLSELNNEIIEMLIERNSMHEKQILPISLESFEINSSLLQATKSLKEFINQYQEKRNMHLQRENGNNNSKFKAFITSFITDVIGFTAAFLTVIVTLVIIYILTGQSKLKTLVANIALQHIKNSRDSSPQPNEYKLWIWISKVTYDTKFNFSNTYGSCQI